MTTLMQGFDARAVKPFTVNIYIWASQLTAKMKAEDIKDFSDAEVERVFKGCVSANRCIVHAKELIALGEITLN